MPVKCVIFDMDGTLIDSNFALCATINEIRAFYKLDSVKCEYILNIINNPNLNQVRELYGVERIDAKFDGLFNKNYLLHARAYDEALNLVKSCKKMGLNLAVASNAAQSSVNSVLEHCKMREYFDFTIGAGGQIQPKPDPAMLNVVVEKFQCDCVFIGDSAKDFLAAKAAKMPYIQVLWGRNERIEGVPNCLSASDVMREIKELA